MRDYLFLDRYLDELKDDIYPQPNDEGHTEKALEILKDWQLKYVDASNVLDVGCGTGFAYKFFDDNHMKYVGIHLGDSKYKPLILTMDFTFTSFDDSQFDLILARHVLEHSPFPLLTLMEWHRIGAKYLILVLPNPEHYTYIGRNHYSVMTGQQARWLLRRAGWEVTDNDKSDATELRYFCEKRKRVGYEGYIEVLTSQTYENDRDDSCE